MSTLIQSNTRKNRPELTAEQKKQLQIENEKICRLLTVDKLCELFPDRNLPERLFEFDEAICCAWHDDDRPSCKGHISEGGYPLWWCWTCNRMFGPIDAVGLALGCLKWGEARRAAMRLVGGKAALDGVDVSLDDLRPARKPGEPIKRRDLGALLVSPRPVTAESQAADWLSHWGISPEFVAEHSLAFASPGRYYAPHWQMTRRGAWVDSGYALMVPQIDPTGRRVTVRTRRTQEIWDAEKPSKTKAVPGASCDEAISVNGPAWRLFVPRLDDDSRALLTWLLPGWPTDEAPLPTEVEICEGEKDYLLRCEVAEAHVAVIGIQAQSWCQEFADKIPDGTIVRICTHSDRAGLKYQRAIVKSLKGRCPVAVRHQRIRRVDRWVDGEPTIQRGIKDLDEVELHKTHGREEYLKLGWVDPLSDEAAAADIAADVAAAAAASLATADVAAHGPHEYTDLGNAKRLVDRHGENIRYCAAWEQWLIWDGTRWAPDEERRIDLLAQDTVESILKEPLRVMVAGGEAAAAATDAPPSAGAEIVTARAEVARVAAAKADAARAEVARLTASQEGPAALLKAESVAARAAAAAATARAAAEKAAAEHQPSSSSAHEAARMAQAEWAHNSQQGSHLREVTQIARARVAVRPAQLDANRWLLNCHSGVIDLKTGLLRGASRDLLQTKIAGATYNVGLVETQCPTWIRFLNDALGGNKALIDFIQRAAGYSITGSAKEERLFVLLGPGGSGKGTFINTVQRILGGYAKSFTRSLVADRSLDEHPTDLAGLEGVRFAVVSELKRGSHLATDTVKLITSRDVISARKMGQDFKDQEVTHKLWIMSQFMPRVDADDTGIWRRVLAIPFECPPEKKDEELPEKLEKEWPGILLWLVQGCLEWQRTGLRPPDEVFAKTSEIRSREDSVGDFLDEMCDVVTGLEIEKGSLFERYARWCDLGRVRAQTKNDFGTALELRGFKGRKSGSRRFWLGLDLKPEPIKTAKPDHMTGLLDALPCLNPKN